MNIIRLLMDKLDRHFGGRTSYTEIAEYDRESIVFGNTTGSWIVCDDGKLYAFTKSQFGLMPDDEVISHLAFIMYGPESLLSPSLREYRKNLRTFPEQHLDYLQRKEGKLVLIAGIKKATLTSINKDFS